MKYISHFKDKILNDLETPEEVNNLRNDVSLKEFCEYIEEITFIG